MAIIKKSTNWINTNFKTQEKNGTTKFAVGNVVLEEIIKFFPPPLYVYDAEIIRYQYRKLVNALAPQNMQIYYSVKANTSLAIIQELYHLGSGLEVASLGELLAAKKIDVDPHKISFAGPVKTKEELAVAIDYGIYTINVESKDEFFRINEVAKQKGIKQRVGIRINPLKEVADAGGLMGGGSKKFGFDEECITEEFIQEINTLQNVELIGVHVFAATQILNSSAFLANIKNTCTIAEKLNELFPVEYIDFGGGLGIPYNENDPQLSLDEISRKIGAILEEFEFLKKRKTQLYVEPGRFLVGASGIYITQVDHVKKSRGKEIVLVDGGVHHMLRPALSVGSSTHPIYNLTKIDQPLQRIYDIGGSLCTSLDFLGKDISLPITQPGDLLGVFNAGAYGWSESMPFFLSHGIPGEVMVDNDSFYQMRKPISPEKFLENQLITNN